MERLATSKTASKEQSPKQSGHAFFFAGVRGNNRSLRAVQSALEQKFGAGNATTYNSAFLAEKPSAERFMHMAAAIKEKLQEGPVTILTHSYGAVEALRALTADESLLRNQDTSNKIKLILISPVIPDGWTGMAKTLLTFGKVNIQEGRLLGVVFPGKTSIASGILSANSLTSDVMSTAELDAAASLASPKLLDPSHAGSQTVADYEKRDYLALYEQDVEDRVRANHRSIKNAKGRWATRRAFQRTGRIRREIWPLFDGKYSDDFSDPTVAGLPEGNSKEALALQRRLIIDSGQKREKARYDQVQKAGIEIWRVDPKYDLMHTGRKAARRPYVPDDHVVQVPFATHVGPWSVQTQVLSAIIDACNAGN